MKLGTRTPTLAVTRSTWVAGRLRDLGHEIEIVTIRTCGDHERGSPTRLSGLRVFAAELRSVLLRGEMDLAVHSLKDLPVDPIPELVIAVTPGRGSPRDALCSHNGLSLTELPGGARVGTGSPRRVAQLRALRSDLIFVDIRGNIGTRLSQMTSGDLDAMVLAAVGLRRLGLARRITEELPILPAPGQGTLGIECRTDDATLIAALKAPGGADTRLAATEERAVLAALSGSYATPIAALGTGDGLAAGAYPVDGIRQTRTEVPLISGAGRTAATQLLVAGTADMTQLGATHASQLAEFHDGADLWLQAGGRRVFLPREMGTLSKALSAAGLKVTTFPVQVPVVLLDRLDLGQADWSVVTSTRTVEAPQRLGVRLPERIAAVDKAIAAAPEAVGYAMDFVPRKASAAGILEKFPAGAGRVVIPGSTLSKPDLPEGLRELGWWVEVSPVYTMEATQEPTELTARQRTGEFAAVVVTADSVARMVDERLGWPKEIRVLTIGQPTAKVLNELGMAASVSPSPRTKAVARATAELVGEENA